MKRKIFCFPISRFSTGKPWSTSKRVIFPVMNLIVICGSFDCGLFVRVFPQGVKILMALSKKLTGAFVGEFYNLHGTSNL